MNQDRPAKVCIYSITWYFYDCGYERAVLVEILTQAGCKKSKNNLTIYFPKEETTFGLDYTNVNK